MARIILFLLFLTLISCTQSKQQIKFDRAKWWDGDIEIYPYRDAMLDDLLKHPIKGMTYKELTRFVGEPDRRESNIDSPYYPVVTDYRSDIDPVYTKSLVLYLNKDSVITAYKIKEWGKK